MGLIKLSSYFYLTLLSSLEDNSLLNSVEVVIVFYYTLTFGDRDCRVHQSYVLQTAYDAWDFMPPIAATMVSRELLLKALLISMNNLYIKTQ